MVAEKQAFIVEWLFLFESKFLLQKTGKTFVLNFIKQNFKLGINSNYLSPDSINIGSDVQIITSMLIMDSFKIVL